MEHLPAVTGGSCQPNLHSLIRQHCWKQVQPRCSQASTTMVAEETDLRGDSEEKLALLDFAYRLQACNYSSEPGIADESSTRDEAKLLMCLLSSPLRSSPEEDWGTVSASESEQSMASDSSYSRRDVFSFTCPSLSLEPLRSRRRASPATLLSRTLKVDDRDALRLSADAMARNVRESFQKAIEWRTQAWIHALSKPLVRKEGDLQQAGATEDEIKALLETPEARLILQLRSMSDAIQVTAAGTTFQVLDQVEDDQEPMLKKQRVHDQHQANLSEEEEEEEDSDCYKVAHVLMMEGTVSLLTPAGFTEITLQVPGTITGSFLSAATGYEELRSVDIALDTEILAAMVEKACRTVVRVSVEAVNKADDEEEQEEETEHPVTVPEFMTPPSMQLPTVSAEDVRAALITPKALFAEPSADGACSPKPMLQPIPDNLDDRVVRRISPLFEPRTPKPTSSQLPSLVSPSYASNEYSDVPANGPSLPMLVEAACRAMEDK